MNTNLTYLISGSFGGEVDWSLPILYYLKTRKGVKIRVLLTRNIFKEEAFADNKFLASLLLENVSFVGELYKYLPFYIRTLIWPIRYLAFQNNSLSTLINKIWRRIKSLIIDKIDIDRIKKDFEADAVAGPGYMFDLFDDGQTKKIDFIEGSGFAPMEASGSAKCDLIYMNYNYGRFAEGEDKGKYFFGMPKLDYEWRDYLNNKVSKYAENIKPKYAGKDVFVLFDRDPKPHLMLKSTRERLVNEAVEIVGKVPNGRLLIKVHPRNMYKTDKKNGGAEISNEYPPVLAQIAKAVISMSTSACLDSIVCGCPTVDYFTFDSANTLYKPDKNGEIKNEFRSFELCEKADNKEDLESFINKALNGRYLKDKYIDNLSKVFERNGAMKKAAEALYQLLEG